MTLPAEKWTIDYFITNKNECLSRLDEEEFLSSIPNLDSVSLDSLKDGQVVRFQGMIQDMRNPEVYFEKYVVKNTVTEQLDVRHTMYKDMMQIGPDEELVETEENKNGERQTFIVITVPGLNDWTKKKVDNKSKKKFDNIFEKPVETISKKRQHEETKIDKCDITNKEEKDETTKQKIKKNFSPDDEEKLIVSLESILNLPIPNENGKSCIVKLYGEDAKGFKLNDVINIIGFISLDPCLSVFHDSKEMISDIEVQIHNPPASIIPRLHAIKTFAPVKPILSDDAAIISDYQNIRAELYKILNHLLFNDNLATEYLICHLISSIYKRTGHLCLGAFPINITNFPIIKQEGSSQSNNKDDTHTFPKMLYSFIAAILQKSVYLDCSLENLNDLSFVPKKDYECDRLTSGILQLSPNTHLVIDETKLTTGNVSENGRKNYSALCDIVEKQNLEYDFKYYKVTYETDIPILILSEVASFIKGTTRVPIKSYNNIKDYSAIVNAISMYIADENLLNRIRNYLHILKFANSEIDDCVSETISQDLVELKHTNKDITADDFHRCIVFARLMALSRGLSNLTCEIWKEALNLEKERINRISNLIKNK